MHFETSPGSSPSKSIPIAIRTMGSPTNSLYSNYSQDATCSSQAFTCAYPSWPTGRSLEYRSSPSSFISDADLFGEDCDEESAAPLLQQAPAPPRTPPMAHAYPVLPPLYNTQTQEKAKRQQQQAMQMQQQEQQQRRRSSGRKQRRSSKPMSPIAESIEVAE